MFGLSAKQAAGVAVIAAFAALAVIAVNNRVRIPVVDPGRPATTASTGSA